jgi:hypothetical protein
MSTMVDLDGPLPHSVAASLHKVSISCNVGCRLLLTPRGGSERFVVFHCHWPLLELEIKHKHGGFNINYEKATVVWQQFGFGSQS